jgi:exonuclease III
MEAPSQPQDVDRRTVKLISWNTNARRRVEHQVQALLARRPDIVALQEITARSVGSWVETLTAGGLHHVQSTATASPEVQRGPHAYSVLIACRYPLGDQSGVSFPAAPWQEKVLSLVIETPLGELAMHTVHVPNGSANRWAKVEMLSLRAHHTNGTVRSPRSSTIPFKR